MGINMGYTWIAGRSINELVAAGHATDHGPITLDEAFASELLAAIDIESGTLILDPMLVSAAELEDLDELGVQTAGLIVSDVSGTYRLMVRDGGVERVVHEDASGDFDEADPSLVAELDPTGELAGEFAFERLTGYFTALIGADPLRAPFEDGAKLRGLDWAQL